MNQPYQNTPETLRRAALHSSINVGSKNGTYTSQPQDTTGLGEFSDAQLVKELVDRGAMGRIIGETIDLPPMSHGHIEDGSIISGGEIEERSKVFNNLINSQHQRIKKLIGER